MSVTAAKGFRAGAVASGIKSGGRLDLTLVTSEETVPVAGVFTRSLTAAPPVRLSQERIRSGTARAVVLNSGCANAATGRPGWDDAVTVSRAVAERLGCEEEEVLVCSTGPIGVRLPVPAMVEAVPGLVAVTGGEDDHGLAAATGILTTDSRPKQHVVEVGPGVIGGMAKGAGMIRPDMATMLAVLTTDLVVDPEMLQMALASAVEGTFNCLDIDGCQSTNDTVLVFASGRSGYRPSDGELGEAMFSLCRNLAAQMAADAEGASKVVEIRVRGTGSVSDARRLGLAVADSGLVRCSFYGADPNWGRLLGAMGVAGVAFDPDSVSIAYQGVKVCAGGVRTNFDEEELVSRLVSDFSIDIEVGDGPGEVTVLTTDLTPDYVRFNGDRS